MSPIRYNMTIGETTSFLRNKIQELTAEKFTLYPFQEIPTMEIPSELTKYNFNQREAYDVLDDFDKPPDKLTASQKVLRKKYLNIVLSLMDTMNNDVKNQITQMINNDDMNEEQRNMLRKYALGNYDPAFNTIKRVINLLIKELDPNACTPTACTPVDCKPTACTPVDCKPTACKPTACKPTACTPTACTPTACTPTPCTPTACDPAVKKTPFIIAISVLSIFLVIMIIIIIYLGISRSRSR